MFPEVILCPKQPFKMSAAKSRGYADLDDYFFGRVSDFLDCHTWNQTFTWAGNKNEDLKKVSEELSNLEAIQNCQHWHWYEIWYEVWKCALNTRKALTIKCQQYHPFYRT